MNDDFKKKKRTPGISPLIRQIKEITEKIQEINTAIQTCKDNIIQINKEEREISPKAKLIEKKQILFTELKNVNEEKESLINEKNLLLPELTKQKESIFTDKKKFNLKETRENILKRIASIENKIISTRLTPQKEKEFERELTELKKKKTLTENLKDNEKLILQLNERIENLKKQINEKIKKKY